MPRNTSAQASHAEHAPITRHLNRATKWLAFFAFLLLSSHAWADIDIKPQYEDHEPIVAKVTITDVPDGAKLRGSFSVSDGSFLASGENVFHVWAKPGTHVVKSQGVWVLTNEIDVNGTKVPVLVDFGQYNYERTFVVAGGGDIVPPPPPPVQGGPYQIWMLYDADTKDNLPKQQQAILASLTFRLQLEKAGHRVLGVSAAQALTTPEVSKYAAFFAAAKNLPLPCLVVSSLSGGKCVALPLPVDEAATEKLLATELLK